MWYERAHFCHHFKSLTYNSVRRVSGSSFSWFSHILFFFMLCFIFIVSTVEFFFLHKGDTVSCVDVANWLIKSTKAKSIYQDLLWQWSETPPPKNRICAVIIFFFFTFRSSITDMYSLNYISSCGGCVSSHPPFITNRFQLFFDGCWVTDEEEDSRFTLGKVC